MPTPRKATLADLPSLVQLMRAFHAESDFVLDSDAATKAFATLLKNEALGVVWLAGDSSHPEAYVVVTFRFSMEFGAVEAVVDDLYVQPRARRRGIGRALLTEVFAECTRRHVCAVKVETGHDNDAARRLYKVFRMAESDRLTLVAELSDVPMSKKTPATPEAHA